MVGVKREGVGGQSCFLMEKGLIRNIRHPYPLGRVLQ